MRTGHYSDGSSRPECLEIAEDTHAERGGLWRAYWTPALPDGSPDPEATSHCPAIGYCSPGGSHRLVRRAVDEVRRLYPNEPVYKLHGRYYHRIA